MNFIRKTYIYKSIYNNCGLNWNENEFATALHYATTNFGGKLWCLHRTNRNISRLRKDGSGFIDAPEDGRTDLTPAKAKAIDQPVLMLSKENGKATNGWRDAEFYWPMFVAQQKLRTISFTAIKPRIQTKKLSFPKAKRISSMKKAKPLTDTIIEERKFDRLVYELYGLTEEEINIVKCKKNSIIEFFCNYGQ